MKFRYFLLSENIALTWLSYYKVESRLTVAAINVQELKLVIIALLL